jgi:hypothetical protein
MKVTDRFWPFADMAQRPNYVRDAHTNGHHFNTEPLASLHPSVKGCKGKTVTRARCPRCCSQLLTTKVAR